MNFIELVSGIFFLLFIGYTKKKKQTISTQTHPNQFLSNLINLFINESIYRLLRKKNS